MSIFNAFFFLILYGNAGWYFILLIGMVLYIPYIPETYHKTPTTKKHMDGRRPGRLCLWSWLLPFYQRDRAHPLGVHARVMYYEYYVNFPTPTKVLLLLLSWCYEVPGIPGVAFSKYYVMLPSIFLEKLEKKKKKKKTQAVRSKFLCVYLV